MHSEKEGLLKLLNSFDELEGVRQLTVEQILERNKVKEDFLLVAAKEEIFWRQKCKQTWLREGGENTKFFHRFLANKRRKSTITEILSRDGRSLTMIKDIEDEFIDFYTKLYSRKDGQRFCPNNLDWDPITLENSQMLELPFTEGEILPAINCLRTDKAPGPDGYTVEFFEKSWNIIKTDMLAMFQDFF